MPSASPAPLHVTGWPRSRPTGPRSSRPAARSRLGRDSWGARHRHAPRPGTARRQLCGLVDDCRRFAGVFGVLRPSRDRGRYPQLRPFPQRKGRRTRPSAFSRGPRIQDTVPNPTSPHNHEASWRAEEQPRSALVSHVPMTIVARPSDPATPRRRACARAGSRMRFMPGSRLAVPATRAGRALARALARGLLTLSSYRRSRWVRRTRRRGEACS